MAALTHARYWWRHPLARVVASGILLVLALSVHAAGFARAPWGASLRDVATVAAALVAGAGIAARAVASLRRRQVGIEALVTLAAIGAIVIGEFWEAAAVTFLFGLGHALEARALHRTRGAVAELLALLPTEVRLLRDGVERGVAPHAVLVGDVVVVRPGERIPVDGVVTAGHAAVDESTLTGESMPVHAAPGRRVSTGTISLGYLEIRAEAVGADTTLAHIVHLVEASQEARPPRQRAIERFARFYTPAVVAGSVLAFVLTRDVHLALTLLVIACPGALVIATPTALVAGIGRAARDGVLVKGGEAFERLARVRTVAFDKTGTLTRGRPSVREVVPVGEEIALSRSEAAQRLLTLAAQAETGSEHPLADAIRAAAPSRAIARPDAVEVVAGGGTRARLDQRTVVVGSADFLTGSRIDVPTRAAAALRALHSRGRTVSGVAEDGRFLGWIAFADELRPHARGALESLRRLGVGRFVMLTGDNERAAAAVARELGIDDVRAGLQPGDKTVAIEALTAARDLVAMVGDGVNDAPALARADVGVAMGAAGTRVALETAPVALMGDDLRTLARAMETAQRSLRIIDQNLAIALGTVVVLVAGVLAGAVHMAGGMLVHQASVLLVVLNSLRLLRRPGVAQSPSTGVVSRPATTSGSGAQP
jgi:Zn2+/Cd2+-exporting ATPase